MYSYEKHFYLSKKWVCFTIGQSKLIRRDAGSCINKGNQLKKLLVCNFNGSFHIAHQIKFWSIIVLWKYHLDWFQQNQNKSLNKGRGIFKEFLLRSTFELLLGYSHLGNVVEKIVLNLLLLFHFFSLPAKNKSTFLFVHTLTS